MSAGGGSASTFVPPLQTREARPIGAMAFVFLLFLLPIGSCGSMGGFRLHQALDTVTDVAVPSKVHDVAPGKYVSAELGLTRLARDEFPVDSRYALVAKGYESYSVEGTRDVIVIAPTDPPLLGAGTGAPASPSRVRVTGQMCDADAALVCQVPEHLGRYVRHLQDTRKTDVRVLVANETPRGMLWEACVGLGTAFAVFLMSLLGMWLILRASRSQGVLAFERQVTLPHGADAVRAKLRAQANPMCRIAHDGADLFVLLVGKTMGQARLSGAREPTEVPLRVDVVLGPSDAYRGGAAQVRIFALWGAPKTKVLAPAAQLAVQRAAAWIVGVCEGP